jgi:hypothetical protein
MRPPQRPALFESATAQPPPNATTPANATNSADSTNSADATNFADATKTPRTAFERM